MDRLAGALAAPAVIVGQVMESPAGRVITILVLAALVGWIAVRRPSWRTIWPTFMIPAPWVALIVWAGWHARDSGPQTGFMAEGRGLLMLGVTLALSVLAVIRAERVRWPVAGLCLVNGLFAMIAALFAVMMTTGTWL